LISVGIPVRNGGDYLAEALDSILAQDLEDFEILISDNASDDLTEEIGRNYAAKDARVSYHRNPENVGAAPNYNAVFQRSRGRFFKWAAHDDVLRPTFLRRCLETFEANPAAVVVHPRSDFIDAAGRYIRHDTDRNATSSRSPRSRLAHLLRTVNMAAPVFGLMRREALERTRLIDSLVASDYILLAELALLGHFVEVPEVLFLRRLHGKSSREANRTEREVAEWFDPSKLHRRFLTTRQRLMVEYMRSCWRLRGLSLGDRLTCAATVPLVVTMRRIRTVGGRWKRRLQASTRREGPVDA